jgi:hypothetical protein
VLVYDELTVSDRTTPAFTSNQAHDGHVSCVGWDSSRSQCYLYGILGFYAEDLGLKPVKTKLNDNRRKIKLIIVAAKFDQIMFPCSSVWFISGNKHKY